VFPEFRTSVRPEVEIRRQRVRQNPKLWPTPYRKQKTLSSYDSTAAHGDVTNLALLHKSKIAILGHHYLGQFEQHRVQIWCHPVWHAKVKKREQSHNNCHFFTHNSQTGSPNDMRQNAK